MQVNVENASEHVNRSKIALLITSLPLVTNPY